MNIEVITLIPSLKDSTISAAFEALYAITSDRKEIVSALTLLEFKSGEIATVVRPITRARSGDFRADFYQYLIDDERTNAEANAFVMNYDNVTDNTVKSIKLFERDAELTRSVRANERAKVKAEFEAKPIKKKA